MSRAVKKANKASTTVLSRVIGEQNLIPSTNYMVHVLRASELSPAIRDAIWHIFCDNMEVLYKSTDVFDWNPAEKRSELFNRASRFLVVTEEGDKHEASLLAYSMFRFDVEENMDGKDEGVLYCYELQVSKISQGLGVGKALVRLLERLGRQWSMEKVMLTVIKANVGAVRFYQGLGFVTDPISPDDVGYFILSKLLLPDNSG